MQTSALYLITKTPDGYSWRLVDDTRSPIAQSATPFKTIEECRRAIEFVRGTWNAPIQEEPKSAPQ
jgi:hypothetical protein